MPLTIHDDARKRFDQLADEVLATARPVPDLGIKPSPQHANDERHMMTLGPEQISEIRVENPIRTPDGIAMRFNVGDQAFELSPNAYTTLNILEQRLGGSRPIGTAVSPSFFHKKLMTWLRTRLSGQDNGPFSDHLLTEINRSIQHYRIAIPIPYLRIESSFALGAVTFDRGIFSKTVMDQWEADLPKDSPDDVSANAVVATRMRKTYQGHTCAVISVEAEPAFAAFSAAAAVDEALSVLRLFSPSAFVPTQHSLVGREGQVLLPGLSAWSLKDGRPSRSWEHTDDGYATIGWYLDDAALAQMRALGLPELERILLKDERTALDEAVMHACALLDESISCPDLKKKVALAFVAVESLLLENPSEPIQHVVAARCAYLVGRDPVSRMKLDALIKRAYALRSKYIHYGRSAFDPLLTAELTGVIRAVIITAALHGRRSSRREDLLGFAKSRTWGA